MNGLDPIEAQTRRIAARRAQADRVVSRRRSRARAVPPVAVGLSVLAMTGAAAAWVDHRMPAAPLPDPTATRAAQLAADARALREIATALAADNRAIAGLRAAVPSRGIDTTATTATGGGGGGAGASGLPALPAIPSINVPSGPAVQTVTGASGAVVP